ncbi:glycosyltransferase [Phragmitibacter flavus]|nr:glycosyltransferase [Phragmitibacter flavus]
MAEETETRRGSGLRVVHVSSSDRAGGAALAMWGLHDGLCRLGVDSRVVVRHCEVPDARVSVVRSDLLEMADRFHTQRLNGNLPEGATCVSLVSVVVDLLEHPWVAEADVVHLHWVATFLRPEVVRLLEAAGKTVFMTLHDQRHFTGFCHFTAGCRGFETDCANCPQADEGLHAMVREERLRLNEAYGSRRVQVIASSKWVAREALASGLFDAEQLHVLRYAVADVFRVKTRRISPQRGTRRKQRWLFGCQVLGERRKGLAELQRALNRAMESEAFAAAVASGAVELRAFGEAASPFLEGLPVPVQMLGTLRAVELATEYREADVFWCPTLEDTGPLVAMEALACGCPVAGFATGILPDLVTEGVNGSLVPPGDVEGLAELMKTLVLEAGVLSRLGEGAELRRGEVDSVEVAAGRMLDLYEERLARWEPVAPVTGLRAAAVTLSSRWDEGHLPEVEKFFREFPVVSKHEAQLQHLRRRLEVEIGKKEALKRKVEVLRLEVNERDERRRGGWRRFWSSVQRRLRFRK